MTHLPPQQRYSLRNFGDYLHFLIEMLFKLEQGQTRPVSNQIESARSLGVWLIGTLLCLPLLFPTLAVASGTLILFPPMQLGGELEYGLVISFGILAGWITIGVLGKCNLSEMRWPHYLLLIGGGGIMILSVVLVAFFISMMLCGLAIGSMRDGPTLGTILSLSTSIAFTLTFASVCFLATESVMGRVGLGMTLSIMLGIILGGIPGILFTVILTIPLWEYVAIGSLPGLIIVICLAICLTYRAMQIKQPRMRFQSSVIRITLFFLSLLGYVEIVWMCFFGGWNMVA